MSTNQKKAKAKPRAIRNIRVMDRMLTSPCRPCSPTPSEQDAFDAHNEKTYGTKVVHRVWVTKVPKPIRCLVCASAESYDPSEYMIIDTGCERMVSGFNHISARARALGILNIVISAYLEHEQFSFGDDTIHVSHQRMVYPGAIRGKCFIIRQSTVDLDNLPLLASRYFMQFAGMIINTLLSTISLVALDIMDIPMVIAPNGHIAIKIDEFWNDIPDMSTWPEDDNDFGGSPELAEKLKECAAKMSHETLVAVHSERDAAIDESSSSENGGHPENNSAQTMYYQDGPDITYFESPEDYGLDISKEHLYEPYVYRTDTVRNSTDWVDYAKAQNTSYKTLRIYNPWIQDDDIRIGRNEYYRQHTGGCAFF